MAHLGDRVTALVDGQLPPDAIDRAHAHLAVCRACRDLVERERLTKARLASLQDPAPGPELVARLLALGGPAGPMAPRERHVPGTPRPAPLSRPRAAVRPGSERPAGRRATSTSRPRPAPGPRRRARRRARLAVAVLGALTALGTGVSALAASAGGTAGPTLVPPVATFVVDHADTTSNLPFVDVPAGWQTPVTQADGTSP